MPWTVDDGLTVSQATTYETAPIIRGERRRRNERTEREVTAMTGQTCRREVTATASATHPPVEGVRSEEPDRLETEIEDVE
jgi:hypothetical protein